MARVPNESVSRRKNELIASNNEEPPKKMKNKGLLVWTIRTGESCFIIGIGQKPRLQDGDERSM